MKLKKLLAVLLVLCLLPVYAFAEAPDQTYMVKIGSSSYAVPVPYSFFAFEPNKEDVDLGAVSMFISEETPVQLYIYEDVLEDYNSSMAEYLASEGEAYAVEEIPTEPAFTVGDVDVYLYENVVELGNGKVLQYENYAFEEDGIIYELDFPFEQGDEEQLALIQAMVDGIEKIELTQLCGSDFGMYCPGFVGEDISEEGDDVIAEQYINENCELTFVAVRFSGEGLSIDEYLDAITEDVDEDIVVMHTLDADIYIYPTLEEYEDEEIYTLNCVFEAGDEFMQISFLFQNENSGYQAVQMISTLKKL